MKKNLVLAGMLAAMVTVSVCLLPLQILPNNGFVHLGDAVIFLAAAMLPTPYAIAAAAIPYNAIQELAGCIGFVLLAVALDRLHIKNRLNKSR